MCIIGQNLKCEKTGCEWVKGFKYHCSFRTRNKYPPFRFVLKKGIRIIPEKHPLPDVVVDKYRRDPIRLYEKQNYYKPTIGFIERNIRQYFERATNKIDMLSIELDAKISLVGIEAERKFIKQYLKTLK